MLLIFIRIPNREKIYCVPEVLRTKYEEVCTTDNQSYKLHVEGDQENDTLPNITKNEMVSFGKLLLEADIAEPFNRDNKTARYLELSVGGPEEHLILSCMIGENNDRMETIEIVFAI